MRGRPYVLLSVAASLDGYIDDTSTERLILSNEEDLDRVDEVRASVDAILVGAGTVRADNPRLLVRSPERRRARESAGRRAEPLRATVTASGELDPAAALFTEGESVPIVYTGSSTLHSLRGSLADGATIVDAGEPITLAAVLSDLDRRGVARLLVEGGGAVLTWFLTSGLADELHLVYASLLLGQPDAPRFVHSGRFPARPELVETRTMGDCVLLRYQLRGGGHPGGDGGASEMGAGDG